MSGRLCHRRLPEGAGRRLARGSTSRLLSPRSACTGGRERHRRISHRQRNISAKVVREADRRKNTVSCNRKHSTSQTCRGASHPKFDQHIALNLKSVWLCMKHEIEQMLKQGSGGAIVNASSVNGLGGLAQNALYAAAKAGVLGLTKSAAQRLSDPDAPQRFQAGLPPGSVRRRSTICGNEFPWARGHAGGVSGSSASGSVRTRPRT